MEGKDFLGGVCWRVFGSIMVKGRTLEVEEFGGVYWRVLGIAVNSKIVGGLNRGAPLLRSSSRSPI